MNNIYDPAKIKEALIKVLKGNVSCDNIYPDRPKLKNDKLSPFIVITTSVINDEYALGRTVTQVKVFSKDLNSGPDDMIISGICHSIQGLLPVEEGRYTFDFISISDSIIDSSTSFHYRTILLNTDIIN